MHKFIYYAADKEDQSGLLAWPSPSSIPAALKLVGSLIIVLLICPFCFHLMSAERSKDFIMTLDSKEVYLLFLFHVQVRKAGELVLAAGVVAAVGFGIVALAGALFGGSKKENKSTK